MTHRQLLLVVVSGLLGALAACQTAPQPGSQRRVVARVGGMPIYLSELERELERHSLGEVEGLPAGAGVEVQRRHLLDNLIERRLVLREAEGHNVVVGMDEVETAYERTRDGWDEEMFRQALEERDMTPSELKRELREQLMIRKYFRNHVFARVAVTDRELEAYLEEHPAHIIEPEQVRASQIIVKTDEEAKKVAREIARGMSFEDAAMKYSLSPEAESGGDLGFFSRGVMPSVFDEVCFELRVGEVSAPVSSDYGYHLFTVTERREQRERPVDEIREEVERELRRQKEREAQAQKVAELREEANITIEEKLLAQL